MVQNCNLVLELEIGPSWTIASISYQIILLFLCLSEQFDITVWWTNQDLKMHLQNIGAKLSCLLRRIVVFIELQPSTKKRGGGYNKLNSIHNILKDNFPNFWSFNIYNYFSKIYRQFPLDGTKYKNTCSEPWAAKMSIKWIISAAGVFLELSFPCHNENKPRLILSSPIIKKKWSFLVHLIKNIYCFL